MISTVGYYWIESTDREEVLKVMDFQQGEEVIKKLGEGLLESFEEVEERYDYAEIRERRPPQ